GCPKAPRPPCCTADRKFYATDACSDRAAPAAAPRISASGAKRTTLESKPERGPGGDPLRPVPRRAALPAPAAALLGTARSWRGIVPFTHPRTGGAHDSHHRTAGIAGCTRRRRPLAPCGARATAHGVGWPADRRRSG